MIMSPSDPTRKRAAGGKLGDHLSKAGDSLPRNHCDADLAQSVDRPLPADATQCPRLRPESTPAKAALPPITPAVRRCLRGEPSELCRQGVDHEDGGSAVQQAQEF